MANLIIGRIMFATGIFLFSLFFTLGSFAKTVSVFDVRKNIPMGPNDSVYTDYYINGGSNSGLKEGMILSVNRKFSVNDAQSNKAYGDVSIPVAKIQVIHVQFEISIARLYKPMNRKNMPFLEHDTVMSGDILDLTTAAMTDGEKKGSKESSKEPQQSAQEDGEDVTPREAVPEETAKNTTIQPKPKEQLLRATAAQVEPELPQQSDISRDLL
jgi:hypothetical protein